MGRTCMGACMAAWHLYLYLRVCGHAQGVHGARAQHAHGTRTARARAP